MRRKRKTKIIQVPMPEDLVESLDRLSKEMGESRAFVLREAAVEYVTNAEDAEKERQYIQSYIDQPMTEDEKAWIEIGTKLAVDAWGDEDWSEEYEAWMKEHGEER